MSAKDLPSVHDLSERDWRILLPFLKNIKGVNENDKIVIASLVDDLDLLSVSTSHCWLMFSVLDGYWFEVVLKVEIMFFQEMEMEKRNTEKAGNRGVFELRGTEGDARSRQQGAGGMTSFGQDLCKEPQIHDAPPLSQQTSTPISPMGQVRPLYAQPTPTFALSHPFLADENCEMSIPMLVSGAYVRLRMNLSLNLIGHRSFWRRVSRIPLHKL